MLKKRRMFMYHCRHKQTGGFILPIVLVIVESLMLYGLSAALLNKQLIKEKSDAMIAMERANKANKLLLNIESSVRFDELSCYLPTMIGVNIRLLPDNWWQQHGCQVSEGNQLYYYVIESLGADVCGLMSEISGKRVDMANYYRITLTDVGNSSSQSGMMWQMTVAEPQSGLYQCKEQAHIVKAGRQMWRQI